jgi:hypothetical protein
MTPAIDAHRLRKLAQTASPVIRDYDLHPPDDLRLFPMPKAGVLRFNDDVFPRFATTRTSSKTPSRGAC